MAKSRLSDNQEQELAGKIIESMPDAQEMSVLGLLQFGSAALMKEAIASEITKYLGRGFYKHLKLGDDFRGKRNGYRKASVDTPIGQVRYERPLIAYAPDFESKFHTPYLRRLKAFANAIADIYVNGVSHRSVKRALKSVTGEKIQLSKWTIGRITKRLIEEFKIWQKKDLSKLNIKYLILDAIRLKMRMDSSAKQAVMIAYAVLADGSFETISIAVKNSESNDSWESLIADLKRRGLKDPLLAISEGCLALVYRICVKHQEDKCAFKADDLVNALWSRLREEKISMIKQLELDLEAA